MYPTLYLVLIGSITLKKSGIFYDNNVHQNKSFVHNTPHINTLLTHVYTKKIY